MKSEFDKIVEDVKTKLKFYDSIQSEEYKAFVDGYITAMADACNESVFDQLEYDEESIIGKIQLEIGKEVMDEIFNHLFLEVQDYCTYFVEEELEEAVANE